MFQRFDLSLCASCPLYPVARAFLTIQPNSVTLYSVSSPAVTVMCRAMRSQNPLTSLVVSHRAKHLNFTVQPRELAVTDTDSKVASVADLTITSVTGGLAERLINYTIIQVPALCAGLVPGTSIMCRS